MLKKLRRKFVLLTTSIAVIVLIVLALLLNTISYRSIISYSDRVLQLLVASNLRLGDTFFERDIFSEEHAYAARFFAVHLDEDGAIEFIDTKNMDAFSSQEAVEYSRIADRFDTSTGIIDNYMFIHVDTPEGSSYFFLDIAQELIRFNDYRNYSVLIAFGAIALVFTLSVIFSKRAVSPIAESYERQKRFITDVSHELKTPLSIIKADCDVLELDGGGGEWTDSIKSQINRLNLLVENLVSLTKLDEEQRRLMRTDFSLSNIVQSTSKEFSTRIQSRKLSLKENISENVRIYADENLMHNLLSILFENACKYAPVGSEISVSLHEKSGKKVLTVKNACEPIGVGKHNDWFDRFYRGDASRNSANKGFGIGLSIAKAICDAHGAKISAVSKTGREITFTVTF